MFENTKSWRRRFVEHHTGEFPWMDLIQGKGIDIGCGPDKPFENFVGFDREDGDANRISEYFPSDTFDCLIGSHVLEHMINPRLAIRDWLKILKPGGVAIQTIPDIGAYERFRYPSSFNSDHKSSWSMVYRGSAFPIHIHIPTFLDELSDVAEVLLARYIERNFNWQESIAIDQTMDPMDGVEIWNEFILRKKP